MSGEFDFMSCININELNISLFLLPLVCLADKDLP